MKHCALRLLGSYVVLTALLYLHGSSYSSVWCGAIERVTQELLVSIDVQSVDTAELGNERVFRMTGVTRRSLYAPQGLIPSGTALAATTLQAYANLHLILIASLLMAWPVETAGERLKLMASVIPAVGLATLLDVPFVLAGVALDDLVDVTGDKADHLNLYYRFLQQGGRYLLTTSLVIVAALAVSGPSVRVSRRQQRERGGLEGA